MDLNGPTVDFDISQTTENNTDQCTGGQGRSEPAPQESKSQPPAAGATSEDIVQKELQVWTPCCRSYKCGPHAAGATSVDLMQEELQVRT